MFISSYGIALKTDICLVVFVEKIGDFIATIFNEKWVTSLFLCSYKIKNRNPCSGAVSNDSCVENNLNMSVSTTSEFY